MTGVQTCALPICVYVVEELADDVALVRQRAAVAESQDTALRIFSTLNDRGLPLSDSDIFKAQFYQYYKQQSEDSRNEFIRDWKKLEETCDKIFHPSTGTPMDDLFARYMYFIRAKRDNNKSSTTESLRKFYERDKYSILKQNSTFDDLKDQIGRASCRERV